MRQMPQYQDGTYDDVAVQIDFNLSEHPNPVKQENQNIKRAIKALRPMKRPFWSPRKYWIGGKYMHTKAHQCVIDGANCMGATMVTYSTIFP